MDSTGRRKLLMTDSTVWKETGIYRRWRHPTVCRGKDITTAIHGIKAVTFEREATWRLPGTAPCLVRGVHPPVCWAPCRCCSWHRLSFCPAVRWEQTSGDCVPGQSILKKKNKQTILLSSDIYVCARASSSNPYIKQQQNQPLIHALSRKSQLELAWGLFFVFL